MNAKLTCVTGYWKVKNKHSNKYLDWFKTTLKINAPYIVVNEISYEYLSLIYNYLKGNV